MLGQNWGFRQGNLLSDPVIPPITGATILKFAGAMALLFYVFRKIK